MLCHMHVEVQKNQLAFLVCETELPRRPTYKVI